MLKEAGVRSRCLRSCSRIKVSQSQECRARKGWARAQQQQCILEGTFFQMCSDLTLPLLSKGLCQPIVTLAKDTGVNPWLLSFSYTPYLLYPPIPSAWYSTYRTYLKHFSYLNHSTIPALVQATLIFHPGDWHSLPAHLLHIHPYSFSST